MCKHDFIMEISTRTSATYWHCDGEKGDLRQIVVSLENRWFMPMLSKLILRRSSKKAKFFIPPLSKGAYSKLSLRHEKNPSEFFRQENWPSKAQPHSPPHLIFHRKTSKSESLKSSTIVHKSSPHFVIIITEFCLFSLQPSQKIFKTKDFTSIHPSSYDKRLFCFFLPEPPRIYKFSTFIWFSNKPQ